MYLAGKWEEAKKFFDQVEEIKGSPDLPTSNLLEIMEEQNFKPKDWLGYRILTEK